MFKKIVCVFCCLTVYFMFISKSNALASRETMEQYFPPEVLDSIDEDTYNYYATLDYDNAIRKEVIVPNTDFITDISPNGQAEINGSSYSTNYKVLSLMAIPEGTVDYVVNLDLMWKVIPTTRSFDVIALRFENMGMAAGTQYGYQLYSGGSVSYSYLGTNMNLKSNGFGISMNLINGSTNMLRSFISVTTAAADNARIFGAYEHAISNITLANSKKYTLSYVGMGNVINFDSSVWNKYDDMNGVSINL